MRMIVTAGNWCLPAFFRKKCQCVATWLLSSERGGAGRPAAALRLRKLVLQNLESKLFTQN